MVIRIISFALICATAISLRYGKVVWLKSPRLTPWGQFGTHEFCPKNSFVTGMKLKIDHFHVGDNTALNGIQLICTDMNGDDSVISSSVGGLGYFGKSKYCQNGFATGFQLRSQKGQGFLRDDVAAVDFKLICSDIIGNQSQVIADDKGFLPWGDWGDEQKCPLKSAICGIATQVEGTFGLLLKQDQTSLNNVDIACCPLTRPIESCSAMKYSWKTRVYCPTEGNCETNFRTGVIENKQLSKFRKFFDNQRKKIGTFNNILLKTLRAKAKKDPVKMNNRPVERILMQTQLNISESTVTVNCQGMIQQLVVTCDFITFLTSESQCVPDQYTDKAWEVNGLYFQPTSTTDTIFWSYNCEFTEGKLEGVSAGFPATCGAMCFSNTECTHFVWDTYNGGTCWTKSISSASPVERHDAKMVCGWIERS